MYGLPTSGGAGGGGGGFGLGGSSTLGKVGTYAGAAFLGYQGVRSLAKGGGQGIAAGIGEIAGAAAMVDPEPISKMILMGTALVSGFVSSLFGDPKQIRQHQINHAVKYNQFMAPVSINVAMSTGTLTRTWTDSATSARRTSARFPRWNRAISITSTTPSCRGGR
jgi:hypothetical protein